MFNKRAIISFAKTIIDGMDKMKDSLKNSGIGTDNEIDFFIGFFKAENAVESLLMETIKNDMPENAINSESGCWFASEALKAENDIDILRTEYIEKKENK